MRRGFTIVELMASVGIIGILLSIIIVAAKGSLSTARANRAEAMRVSLEQALAAYYAEVGEWPRTIESRIKSVQDVNYTFTEDEADAIFREVVGKALGEGRGAKAALVDASALFVARTSELQRESGRCHLGFGCDFSELRSKGVRVQDLIGQYSFGYPCGSHGRFRRFWIDYDMKSDLVSVLLNKPEE